MRQPINYAGTYPKSWAGYVYKEKLGYTSGVHTGVDYNGAGGGNSDLGYTIYAVADGTVVAKISNGTVRGFGNAVIIKTKGTPPGVKGNYMYHRYLHCDTVTAKKGQIVKKGQKIGTVGNTGTVYAHLHLDIWTDRNGLGAHWDYHKDTQLSSYEDPYYLIKNNPNWNQGGSEIMDTDAKVKEMYYVLRGNDGTASERKGWIGKPYREFAVKARAEVASREQSEKNLRDAVATLTKERDAARKEVVEVGKKLLAERDKIKVLEAQLKEADAELVEQVEASKRVEDAYQTEIQNLEQSISDKDKEIEKLTVELKNCGTDCDKLTGWELIALGLRKLLGKG